MLYRQIISCWLDKPGASLTDEVSKASMAIFEGDIEFVVQDAVLDRLVSVFLGDVGLSGIERYNP
jgi:hypothetical protein